MSDLLARRAGARAAEAVTDAAECVRLGRYGDAKSLIQEAKDDLDRMLSLFTTDGDDYVPNIHDLQEHNVLVQKRAREMEPHVFMPDHLGACYYTNHKEVRCGVPDEVHAEMSIIWAKLRGRL